MPRGIRRPAPSHLRLVNPAGPVPKGTQKHILPSIPLPTFQPPVVQKRVTHRELPPLITSLDAPPSLDPRSSSRRSSNESERGWPWNYRSHSASSSTSSLNSICNANFETMRGPWDYSSPVRIDVESLLAVPKPVAVSP